MTLLFIDLDDFKQVNDTLGHHIGITIFPDDDMSAKHLMKNADMAMHKAKNGGKNNCHLFSSEADEKLNKN